MSTQPRKRPYHQPQIQVYGDIKTLTSNVAIEGLPDGAGPDAVPNKTN